tara:strand:+ start:1617 stop:1943 length:327 start_codon:yes stop_codon:yes gene_type:complete
MGTTSELVSKAVGMEKLIILGQAIDLNTKRIDSIGGRESMDDQLETIEIQSLAQQYGVKPDTMRRNLCLTLGDNAVIRIGKKWVIRKIQFLKFLQILETPATEDQSTF